MNESIPRESAAGSSTSRHEPGPETGDLLRALPQVEKLLRSSAAARCLESYPRGEVVGALRAVIDALRAEIRRAGGNGAPAAAVEGLRERTRPEAILAAAEARLAARSRPHHRRAINGTGVILHTGLGRAVLPRDALEALSSALRGYTIVEVDPASGERNRREEFAAGLLCELSGAEAATIVNNNAGATLLVLAALARGREVVISRGQLVEIGGSFRIPDVMEESGARLVEVGATNRATIDDYRRAIGPDTAMLLKVHTSNYEIVGFARHTPLAELVELGRERGLTVVSDLGSGCFRDVEPYGFRREPLVRESVAAGADVVCFSGDKLLGGPQAGIILGRRELIERIRRHPLFRALRPGKMTLVALEATLRLYRDPDALESRLPVLRMLTAPPDLVRERALQLRRRLAAAVPALEADVIETAAQTGSGSLPAQDLASWSVAIAPAPAAAGGRPAGDSAERLAAALRSHDPPIFTRLNEDRVLIDLRTVLEGEEDIIVEALRAAAAS